MKIAFFTLQAYDMLTGGYQGQAGGAKRQQVLIAKELSSRGHDVVFVEYDEGGKSETEIDGISIKLLPRPQGNEVRRGIQLISSIRELFQELAPDVCYRRVLDFAVPVLAYYCNRQDIGFVYGVAHDLELGEEPHQFDSGVKATRLYKKFNRLALSRTDTVIVQNAHQYELASDIKSDGGIAQIPNCCLVPADHSRDHDTEEFVLWVGRIQPIKQPEVVLEIAEAFPQHEFRVLGGPGDEQLFESLQDRSATMANVQVEGHVPHEEIGEYYQRATLLLNTSKSEGFPNTFLEAWSYRRPVVSLKVDPDEIISTNELGVVGDGTIEQLKDNLATMFADDQFRGNCGESGYDYVTEHHSVSRIVDKYERVFRSVA